VREAARGRPQLGKGEERFSAYLDELVSVMGRVSRRRHRQTLAAPPLLCDASPKPKVASSIVTPYD
jgi:hypothetical protein